MNISDDSGSPASLSPASSLPVAAELPVIDRQVPVVFRAKLLEADTPWPDPPAAPGNAPPTTIPNLEHLMREHGISVRYNVIKKKTEVVLPDSFLLTDNVDLVAMTHIVSAASLNKLSTGHIHPFVEAVADLNPYNPVADWIKGREWDGVDRLEGLYATIETREDFPPSLKKVLMYRWLLSATAAALKPRGFKARGVLTFQGDQGIGKTSWVRNLIDEDVLREVAIKVDHHLDTGNKDTILGAISHWIVEIGELDSTFRKDVARLKGFLTSDQDKLRRPYARGESEYARRTVFAATVNETNFLVDMTGNSRWWTIPATKINFEHGIDMQQVFAQLAIDFDNGEQWWLTPEEEVQLEEANKHHLAVSAIRDELLDLIDLDKKGTGEYLSAAQVLKKLAYERPTNPQCKECAAYLREFLGESKRIKGFQKWRVPLKQGPRTLTGNEHLVCPD
jgi:predicted P-loop ATPase